MKILTVLSIAVTVLLYSCKDEPKESKAEQAEINNMDSTSKIVEETTTKLEDQTRKVEEDLEKLDNDFKPAK